MNGENQQKKLITEKSKRTRKFLGDWSHTKILIDRKLRTKRNEIYEQLVESYSINIKSTISGY